MLFELNDNARAFEDPIDHERVALNSARRLGSTAVAGGGVRRYTHPMPYALESGKLQLSPEEASAYRTAADRLHEECEMALDLTRAITVEDWIFLEMANAALVGDVKPLDCAIAKVETAIQLRRRHD